MPTSAGCLRRPAVTVSGYPMILEEAQGPRLLSGQCAREALSGIVGRAGQARPMASCGAPGTSSGA